MGGGEEAQVLMHPPRYAHRRQRPKGLRVHADNMNGGVHWRVCRTQCVNALETLVRAATVRMSHTHRRRPCGLIHTVHDSTVDRYRYRCGVWLPRWLTVASASPWYHCA